MPLRPPNDVLTGAKDYLEFVSMRVCLRRLHAEAQAEPYDDFATTVLERVEAECPFVLRPDK